jgi:hypothetical protein
MKNVCEKKKGKSAKEWEHEECESHSQIFIVSENYTEVSGLGNNPNRKVKVQSKKESDPNL